MVIAIIQHPRFFASVQLMGRDLLVTTRVQRKKIFVTGHHLCVSELAGLALIITDNGLSLLDNVTGDGSSLLDNVIDNVLTQ